MANTPIYRSSTTTLPTTTARTEAPRREIVTNGALTDPEDKIFEGCDSTKACFGIPSGCVEKKACSLILTYKPDKLDFNFEMKVGRWSPWQSISQIHICAGEIRWLHRHGPVPWWQDGGGPDNKLYHQVKWRSGHCNRCVPIPMSWYFLIFPHLLSNTISLTPVVTIRDTSHSVMTRVTMSGYNPDYSGNKLVLRGNTKDPADGISARTKFSRKDGWISCSWKRKARATIGNETFIEEKIPYINCQPLQAESYGIWRLSSTMWCWLKAGSMKLETFRNMTATRLCPARPEAWGRLDL